MIGFTITDDPFLAINLVTRILGAAICVTSLEIFVQRQDFSESGILAWSSLNRRLPRIRKMAVAKYFFAYPAYGYWIGGRALAGGILIFIPDSYWVSVLCLSLVLFSGFLSDIRNFSIADTVMQRMQMIVSGALLMRAFSWEDELVAQAVLTFVALNAALTYLFAAIEKLRWAGWRQGRQVYHIANGEWLGNRRLAEFLRPRKRVTRFLTWGTIVFEFSFPLSLIVGVPWVWIFVAASFLFHTLNWLVIRLRGFVITFGSTWPAILYTSEWCNRLLFGN